jgi:hypothetical protein
MSDPVHPGAVKKRGVSITRIASEAGLCQQGIYDLLSEQSVGLVLNIGPRRFEQAEPKRGV